MYEFGEHLHVVHVAAGSTLVERLGEAPETTEPNGLHKIKSHHKYYNYLFRCELLFLKISSYKLACIKYYILLFRYKIISL